MSDPIKAMLAIIPTLSASQIATLRARLDLAASFKPRPITSVEDWISPGIHAELKRRGLTTAPIPVLLKAAPRGYGERREAVQGLLLSRAGRKLNGPERLLLGDEAARALAIFIQDVCQLSVGPKLMLSFIDSVPTAIENAFPGYLQSGLLDFLVRRGL